MAAFGVAENRVGCFRFAPVDYLYTDLRELDTLPRTGDLLSAYRNSIVVVVATTILSFSAFSYLEVGKGATVAMVMLLIIFVVSLAILRNIQKTD